MFKEVRKWDHIKVMQLCIKKDWYTCGDAEDYESMLQYVKDHHTAPTPDHIEHVARDIYDHNDLETIDYPVISIMYDLINETVSSCYTY